jgi:Flp pilus assembly protein TadD
MNLAQQLGLTAEEAASMARVGADLLASGDIEGAQAIFEGLTTLNPDDSAAWAALGYVLQASGDVGKAEHVYRESLSRDPTNSTVRAWLGELLLQRGSSEGRDMLKVALGDEKFARSELGAHCKRLLS